MRADQIVKLIEHRANLKRAKNDVEHVAEYLSNQQIAGTGILWGHLDAATLAIGYSINELDETIHAAKEQMS